MKKLPTTLYAAIRIGDEKGAEPFVVADEHHSIFDNGETVGVYVLQDRVRIQEKRELVRVNERGIPKR